MARSDQRLVADIEKLLKTKIELEPIEISDERPKRPRRHVDETPEPGLAERAGDRAIDRPTRPASVQRHVDPFFDKPYEPVGSGAPSWDSPKAAHPAPTRQLAPNIRARKKVASLLGGGAA